MKNALKSNQTSPYGFEPYFPTQRKDVLPLHHLWVYGTGDRIWTYKIQFLRLTPMPIRLHRHNNTCTCYPDSPSKISLLISLYHLILYRSKRLSVLIYWSFYLIRCKSVNLLMMLHLHERESNPSVSWLEQHFTLTSEPFIIGGESRIWTHGPLWTINSFQDCRHKPDSAISP